MSDVDDVLDALATLCTGTLYPSGPPSPGQNSPITSCPCRIYPGWPAGKGLDADIAARIVNVSVFAPPGAIENVTRYPISDYVVTNPPPKTLTATVSGQTIAIGGTVSVPQNTALRIDGKLYVYGVQAGDTVSSIAAALAALVNVDQPAHASGPVITIDGAHSLIGRIGGVGQAAFEAGRVRQRFMVTVWAFDPASRKAAGAALKTAIMNTKFLTMPDGWAARMILQGDHFSDDLEKPLIYRRDLFPSIEYADTVAAPATEIIAPFANVTGGSGPTQVVTG